MLRPLRPLPLIALVLVLLAPHAQAQLVEAQPGARMRIQAPGIVAGRYVGTVISRTADTLVLGSPTSAPVRVPVSRITSAEVSRGNSRGLGAVQGLKWGVPIGLAVGVLLAAGTSNPDDQYCIDNCGQTDSEYKRNIIIASLFSGAFWGAGIGAIVGHERWERFDITPHTSFDVRDGRTRLGAAVRF